MTGLDKAVEQLKSREALAKALNVTVMTISHWYNRSSGLVPPERVMQIFDVTGVTPHELRPDLYPNPTDGLPPELQSTAVVNK